MSNEYSHWENQIIVTSSIKNNECRFYMDTKASLYREFKERLIKELCVESDELLHMAFLRDGE